MSDFSDDWLALRAPADSRARADAIVSRLQIDPTSGIDVLDLGCGTGANLRHLAPLLAAAGAREQRWTCVDRDSELLDKLSARTAEWATGNGLDLIGEAHEFAVATDALAGSTLGLPTATRGASVGIPNFAGNGTRWRCRVRPLQLDLASALDQIPMPAGGLVTASALLDLVSGQWLDALLQRCHNAQCQLLFTLTYDGRCELSPSLADDASMLDLVNRHQRTDKGFGPALGPDAAAHAEARCHTLRYQSLCVTSDWQVGPDEPALQRALIDGWHWAALEQGRHRQDRDGGDRQRGEERLPDRINQWHAGRIRLIDERKSWLRVGHRDLIATFHRRGILPPS